MNFRMAKKWTKNKRREKVFFLPRYSFSKFESASLSLNLTKNHVTKYKLRDFSLNLNEADSNFEDEYLSKISQQNSFSPFIFRPLFGRTKIQSLPFFYIKYFYF